MANVSSSLSNNSAMISHIATEQDCKRDFQGHSLCREESCGKNQQEVLRRLINSVAVSLWSGGDVLCEVDRASKSSSVIASKMMLRVDKTTTTKPVQA